MIIMKEALPRRTFLRGMGVALGLPLLDAMVPAMIALAATPADPVRRVGFIYMPMGADISRWTPPGEGTLGELSPILQSLSPFADQLTVITNTQLKNAYSPGNHATANSAYLSAAQAKRTEGSDYYLGTTVDQLAAKHIGQDTPLPSLELAMDYWTSQARATADLPAYTRTVSHGRRRQPRFPPRLTPASCSIACSGSGADSHSATTGQPVGLDARRYRSSSGKARRRRSHSGEPVPGQRSRSGAPHPEGRGRGGGQRHPRHGSAARRASVVLRSRAVDVRSPDAGAAG